MTLEAFSEVFALLAIQLRATDADEATIRVYYQALKDLDLAFVRAAAERLALSAEWFPKTSEWRQMAETIRTERLEAQKAQLRAAKQPLCTVCDDTGWEILQLVENGRPVERARPCACREARRRELTGRVSPPLALPGDVA